MEAAVSLIMFSLAWTQSNHPTNETYSSFHKYSCGFPPLLFCIILLQWQTSKQCQ